MSFFQIVYGPQDPDAGTTALLDKALEAHVVLARGYALAGDHANETRTHAAIDRLLDRRALKIAAGRPAPQTRAAE